MSGYNDSAKQTNTIVTQTSYYSLDSWVVFQILGENAGIKIFMVWITLLMSLMFWYLKREVRQFLKITICFSTICFDDFFSLR